MESRIASPAADPCAVRDAGTIGPVGRVFSVAC